MPVPFTEFGRAALGRLSSLNTLSSLIPSDNRAFNSRLHEAHLKRKEEALSRLRALMEPNLAPGENVDDRISYTGEDGSDQNAPYTSALEKFVAESVLCSCVDTYHWYLRRVFQTALTADMSRIDTWKGTLKLSKKRIDAVKDATDLGPAISAIFRGSEEPFRVLAHEFLNVPDLAIIPKAVVVRNCLVHELGEDRSGKVAEAISVENDLGVSIHNNIVTLPIQEAYEISGRFISDISIMDQALANVLHLPTDPSPLPTFSRAYS